MPRWESDAQGRLEQAALDLFEAQGFERTSVAQIATTAGLTERSFYRYFPDKREVLFAGRDFETHTVARLDALDPELAPLQALLSALQTADEVFPSREVVARRGQVIAANPALAERELIKLSEIAAALAYGLQRRGVEAGRARFITDLAMVIFRRATSHWVIDQETTLSDLVPRVATELRELVAQPAVPDVSGNAQPGRGATARTTSAE